MKKRFTDYKRNVPPAFGVIANVRNHPGTEDGTDCVILYYNPRNGRVYIRAIHQGKVRNIWSRIESLESFRPAMLLERTARHVCYAGPGGSYQDACKGAQDLNRIRNSK